MFERVKALPRRLHRRIDDFMMDRLGFTSRQRKLTWHYVKGLGDQCVAVIPISLLQILVLAIFFQQGPKEFGLQVMGLFLAIIGLVLFLDGLRVSVMPLAEVIGEELPKTLALPFVLLIAFFLGILVTYAEPAIAALRPLATLVDPNRAPYLYFIMNKQQELMVFAIGAGVGVAAVIGTLRFIKDWPLKPLIFSALIPTVSCAIYMQWGNENLVPLIGMAWDCGAVTTGPVTVPVLLALGIGVMRSSRRKRLARAALEASVAEGAGQALEGFGIVTLASLLPILAVELMAIIDGAIYPYDEVLKDAQEAANNPSNDSAIDESPLREVIYGIRSILPLNVALLLIIIVILRRPLPECSFWIDEDLEEDDVSVRSGSSSMKGKSETTKISASVSNLARASVAIANLSRIDSQSTIADEDSSSVENSAHGGTAAADALQIASDDTPRDDTPRDDTPRDDTPRDDTPRDGFESTTNMNHANVDIEANQSSSPSDKGDSDRPHVVDTSKSKSLTETPPVKVKKDGIFKKMGRWFRRNLPLLGGIAVAQVGMISFSEGLTYAFTVLGDQTGTTLPAAFLEVPGFPKSPYYSYAGGLILVLVVVFLLGILATRAEPALNVLGRTVERLSGGKFTAKMLILSVAIGVGIGMAVGAAKILFGLPIIYFILGKYAVACGLTLITAESITAVAWDSAGVTTGPVTVPFVLSIGIGFATAVNSTEGFGMLTVASVAPIISVLFVNQIKKPAATVSRRLSDATRGLSRTITRRTSRKMKLGITPSFAGAAFATIAGNGPTPDPSLRAGSSYEPQETIEEGNEKG